MATELRVLLTFALAFGMTFVLTPHMKRVAASFGIIKVPGGRHTHSQPIPLTGGFAIFFGVMVAMAFEPDPALAVALPLALGAGLVDDWCKCHRNDLAALPKLILQFLPAIVLVAMGHSISHVSNPFGPGMLILPWWIDYPLTLAWLVGMANAVNFLDGMDGMVAGLTAIASFTLLIIALMMGSAATAIWVAATLGACMAFLRYNFHPASIFMGDAGANFLGFLLASTAVTGYFKAATLAGLAAPLLILFIPMFNVVYVVIRRMRQGKSFLQALTEGDLEHSFNVLRRKMDFNPMETVLVFLLAAMFLSASALGFVFANR